MEGCHAALKRLQLDYVDLLFCHRPDKNTPIEETVWAMNHLIVQGKVLYWGTSEWSASELMEAYLVAEKNHLIAPTMEQPQYSMLVRDKMEKEYLHLFKHFGLGTTIWSPLASGLLSGKYNQGMPDDTRMNIEGLEWLKERTLQEQWSEKTRRLTDVAAKIGISMPILALAWCLKNPNVSTVILGASKTSQPQENLWALEAVDLLTDEVLEEVERILQNKPEQPQF
jgi:aryl-alcohol dehydrogenase-like predicted oxidoreductase